MERTRKPKDPKKCFKKHRYLDRMREEHRMLYFLRTNTRHQGWVYTCPGIEDITELSIDTLAFARATFEGRPFETSYSYAHLDAEEIQGFKRRLLGNLDGLIFPAWVRQATSDWLDGLAEQHKGRDPLPALAYRMAPAVEVLHRHAQAGVQLRPDVFIYCAKLVEKFLASTIRGTQAAALQQVREDLPRLDALIQGVFENVQEQQDVEEEDDEGEEWKKGKAA